MDDQDALSDLEAAAWSPRSGFPSVIQAMAGPGAAFFSAGNPPESHLVAELAGQVAGYIKVKPPTPLPENSHVMQIGGLAVRRDARRKGIAAALMSAAEQHALAAGARKLSLRVFGTNDPAIRLYERLGFEREGILRSEFLIDGSYVDDILMAKHLQPGR